jgi:transcriptional regulator GlxA family with amidase domain
MRECPELKMADVATRSGFSSQPAFSKIFTKETGQTPREWYKQFSFA